MHPISAETLKFTKEFTRQESIPEAGIQRALKLMKSGRLHRYNTVKGETSEVSLLEKEYADYVGARYCLGLSSCGSAPYVALKSVGVVPGDRVLSNAFTLAPVPGAIEKDVAMAKCRKTLDWEGQFDLAIDPEKARRLSAESGVDEEHGACTMCGEFCAYKVMNERKAQ